MMNRTGPGSSSSIAGTLAETLAKMRLRHAIPTAMKVAEALFHAGMQEVLSVPLLETYRSAGTVAAMYPDATWSDQLPAGAITKDYQLVSFLAYSPDCDQPIIVAEIVVSMWQDDPFTIVKWHPNGQIRRISEFPYGTNFNL